MLIFALAIVPNNLIQFVMSSLVFNPLAKDYFKAKACVAISMRYNYAGSYRSYRFPYLSFRNWSTSYRAAFCEVLKNLENFSKSDESGIQIFTEICLSFIKDGSFSDFYIFLEKYLEPYFRYYFYKYFPVEKLSFVYKLLECLVRYNFGDVRFDLVSPMFEVKSAIRYASSKYFPATPFMEIESDFIFKDVMD